MNARLFAPAVAAAFALIALATGCGGAKAGLQRLTAGQRVDYEPGALAVGSRVACVKGQYRIVVRVPSRGHNAAGVSDFGDHATEISLRTRSNGSVRAVCSYN